MELGQLRFKRFKIVVQTTDSDYGFDCRFEDGLNIIRGDNSSGKSTLINSIIYSIGMEELSTYLKV
ncbi:AAA family ATPase, partial [Leucothrix pacifica]